MLWWEHRCEIQTQSVWVTVGNQVPVQAGNNYSQLGKINCNNHKSVPAPGSDLDLWPWRQEFLFFMEQSSDPAGAWERAECYCGGSVCRCLGNGSEPPAGAELTPGRAASPSACSRRQRETPP